MQIELKENEIIDDLELKGLKIIQNQKGFKYGIDAVLLSDFAKKIKKDSQVLDLGTGTGIISILLCGKTNLKKIIGIEVQKEVAEMAQRSSKINKLEKKFEIINDNILNIEKHIKPNTIDAIVTNPPYKKENTGLKNEDKSKLISRHEILAKLEDYIKISAKMLKDKGEFYIIHRPERIVDIIEEMRKNKIEPKEIRMIYSYQNKPPKMVLLKGIKNGGKYLKFKENLYIYNQDGTYTNEIYEIYNKRRK